MDDRIVRQQHPARVVAIHSECDSRGDDGNNARFTKAELRLGSFLGGGTMAAITTVSNSIGSEFRPAARLQQSITAGIEKKALLWMAERTPASISPDHLTVLGFGAQILASAAYAMARWNKY